MSVRSAAPLALLKLSRERRYWRATGLAQHVRGGAHAGHSAALLVTALAPYRREPEWLQLRVLRGRSLKSCDISGKSDPYALVTYHGQVRRSDTRKRTLAAQLTVSPMARTSAGGPSRPFSKIVPPPGPRPPSPSF